MFIQALTDDPSEVKEILKSLDLYDDIIEDQAPARSPPHSRGLDLCLDLSESQIQSSSPVTPDRVKREMALDEIYLN